MAQAMMAPLRRHRRGRDPVTPRGQAMASNLLLSIPEGTELFKLLGDGPRLHLLLLLRQRGEQHVGALHAEVGMSQPAVSHHLMLLRMGRLVTTRREGKRVYYSLAPGIVRRLLDTVAF